jgi:hypothetical protein
VLTSHYHKEQAGYDDTAKEMERKLEKATIICTMQASVRTAPVKKVKKWQHIMGHV